MGNVCREELFSRLKCSLATDNLVNTPSYTALSYTWGDPKIYYPSEDEIIPQEDWYCQCYRIEIDGEDITVSANLYAALIALRYIKSAAMYAEHNGIQEDAEYIWIDALCINQSDLTEKSNQVQLMRRIYSQSKHVLVWLGGADPISNTAIVVLQKLTQLGLAARNGEGQYAGLELLPEMDLDDPRFYEIPGIPGQISISQWSHIFAFLNRSWFRRAWIIQEFGLANKADMLCGLTMFNDSTFYNWMFFLHDMNILSKLEDIEPLIVAGKQLGKDELSRRALWPCSRDSYTLYKSQEVSLWNSEMFLYLQHVRAMRRDVSKQHLTSLDPESMKALLPIGQNLLLFRSTESSNPRDNIYALLGISHGGTIPVPVSLTPDYSQSPQQIYIQWTEFMIQSDTHLSLLSMVEDPSLRKMDGLLTWVPDFSTNCLPMPFWVPSPLPFRADRGLGLMHAAFPESGVLEVLGYVLNKVSAAARTSDLEKGGIKVIANFLSALPSAMMIKKPNVPVQANSTGFDHASYVLQSRLDLYWRTLITDRFRDEHPAPETCGLAMKISFRRCLSHTASNSIHEIKTSEEFFLRWQNFLEESEAWESILLPGEITPLREKLDKDLPAGPKSRIITLDGGDFGSNIPSEWLDRGDNLPGDAGLEAAYMHEKKTCQRMRKLVIIRPGGLGLAPDSVAVADEVWILAGSQVPFILRPVGNNKYKVIGEAYVHGIMHGEAVEDVDIRNLGIRRILWV